jgi:hypothetical protein
VFRENDRWTFKGDIAGLGIPEGIKEAIGRRLNRLSEEINRIRDHRRENRRFGEVAAAARDLP